MTYYKYTTTSTTELVLKNKSLRWSSPLIFNDIGECQFTPFTEEQFLRSTETYKKILEQCASGCLIFDFNKFSEQTKLLISTIAMCKRNGTAVPPFSEELLVNHGRMHRDYINTGLINCFRILCVTSTFDNQTMWAYYADQHYGCVIELDSVYLKKPHQLREGKVRYHENIEPLSNPLDMFLYGETPEVKELMVKDIIFSKGSKWNHEEEYRFMFSENFGQISFKLDMQTNEFETTAVNQAENSYTDVPIPKNSIKSIIFGARTNKEEIEKIIRIVSEQRFNCKLYQMKMENGSLVKVSLNFQTA